MTKVISLRCVKAVGIAATLIAVASCGGDLAKTGRGPAYLIIESMQAASGNDPGSFASPLLSDVQVIVDVQVNGQTVQSPTVYNDLGQATIRAEFKNPLSTTQPSPIQSVTITRYRVNYRRADGRNTPGVDVPYGFDGAVTRTLEIGEAGNVIFDLVRHQNKIEPPLRNLINHGGLGFITVIGEVTFYGRDQAGNEIMITGAIDIQFGDFGDD